MNLKDNTICECSEVLQLKDIFTRRKPVQSKWKIYVFSSATKALHIYCFKTKKWEFVDVCQWEWPELFPILE